MARKSTIESNQFTDTIYFILLCLNEPAHGYALMSKIEEMTNGEYTIGPGSMYTTLKKLLEAGLVEMCDQEAKVYCLTDKGRDNLVKDYVRRKRIIDQSREIIEGMEVCCDGEIKTNFELGLGYC